ncbi:MAG: helicase-associated domain-containing protein [Treponema sp.]
MHNTDNERTERIIKWREAMATLPDARFFEIMRAYLGEIHTPFNKHKLIERLSSILRNTDNRENIRLFISGFDIKALTAVSIIEQPTQEKLTELFAGEYDFAAVYAELMNLSDRLLVYPHTRKDGSKELRLNPLLDDVLLPFIDLNALLPAAECARFTGGTESSLSPLFIGALVSHVNMFPDMCKGSGELKKKALERLETVFLGEEKRASLLVKAFMNLGVFKYDGTGLFTDEAKLKAFSELCECGQYAYLVVSAAVRFGRENLRAHAQRLTDTLASIPAEGFTKSVIVRAMFLLANKKNRAEVKTSFSRFDRILEAHFTKDEEPLEKSHIAEAIVDAAIEFGILTKIGETTEGEAVFCVSGRVQKSCMGGGKAEETKETDAAHSVVVNAGNSITVMPHLMLKDVLSLAEFSDIARYGTASEFELTKKSVSRAFDKNRTPKDVYRVLETFSAHAIPESLKMNVEEWYGAYSGALLYRGYVLKADEKTQRIIEKSPAFARLIRQKLADGVFFLDIPDGKDAVHAVMRAGVAVTARVKTADEREESSSFPHISYGKNKIERAGKALQTDEKSCANKITELLKIVDSLELDAEQKKCLASRVRQKLIISASQFASGCLHVETLEADGTEYFRKLRLLEDAAAARDIAQITMPEDNTGSAMRTFTGKVQAVLRTDNDATVRLELTPDKETAAFPVSKITRVKIMRGFGVEGDG